MARSKCCTTGKDKFPNRVEADLAIADIHRSNSHNRHRKYREEPGRSYQCEFCQTWHMTSQLERESLTA